MSNENFLVSEAVNKYGRGRENLLPILQEIVMAKRYLSEEALNAVAKAIDLSPAEIYGVASFYSFLDMTPRGKNIIRICKTITCYMKGKDEIIQAIQNRLKIHVGETTADNKFSLLLVNCMGWCHKGPAMLINDKVYTEMTPEKAVKAIEEYL